MAIQVEGILSQNGLMVLNPLLTLTPHLTYRGAISLDIHGPLCWGYESVDKSLLSYDDSISDPYSKLIRALENYVIGDLTANPANAGCTFTIV